MLCYTSVPHPGPKCHMWAFPRKSKDGYQETTWAVGKLLVLKGEVLGGHVVTQILRDSTMV